MNEELQLCPKCKKHPRVDIISKNKNPDNWGADTYYKISHCDYVPIDWMVKQKAIEVWNKRA